MAFMKKKDTADRSVTPIPNRFFDEHMINANPAFAAVYLLGYRFFYHGETDVTNRVLADNLKLMSSDVRHAWEYWAERGLVTLHGGAQDADYTVEFLDITPSATPIPAKENKKTPAKAADADSPDTEPSVPRTDYSLEELSRQAESCSEVRRLFTIAERMLAKPLKYTEMNLLLGFYDWLKLPVDVVEVMLDYCVSNGHKSWRYIEKVALDWSENQITTINDAESYIQLFNGEYREIMKSFGQNRRDPNPKEIVYMKKWLREYKMPVELIKEACDRTIMQIGQPKFSYADTILTDWHNNSATTLADIEALEESFRKNKTQAEPKHTGAQAKPGKNRFNNYTGRTWDYETLEKLEQERLNQSTEK